MEVRIDQWYKTGKCLIKKLPFVFEYCYENNREKLEKLFQPDFLSHGENWEDGFGFYHELQNKGAKAVYIYSVDEDWPSAGTSDFVFVWFGDSLEEIAFKLNTVANIEASETISEDFEGMSEEDIEEELSQWSASDDSEGD